MHADLEARERVYAACGATGGFWKRLVCHRWNARSGSASWVLGGGRVESAIRAI